MGIGMNISYNGYDTKYLTMQGENVKVGSLIALGADNEAVEAKTDANFIGVVVTKRDNLLGVQEQGYIELGYTGEIPNTGYCRLVASTENKVKNDDAKGKKYYKVIKIDKSNNIVGFLL